MILAIITTLFRSLTRDDRFARTSFTRTIGHLKRNSFVKKNDDIATITNWYEGTSDDGAASSSWITDSERFWGRWVNIEAKTLGVIAVGLACNGIVACCIPPINCTDEKTPGCRNKVRPRISQPWIGCLIPDTTMIHIGSTVTFAQRAAMWLVWAMKVAFAVASTRMEATPVPIVPSVAPPCQCSNYDHKFINGMSRIKWPS